MNVIGIDIGGTSIKAAIVSQSGQLIKSIRIPIFKIKSSAQQMAETIKSLIIELLKIDQQIDVIGIGVPGTITKDGKLTAMPNLAFFNNYPLEKMLKKSIAKTIYIDNATNNAARAEFLFGNAKNKSNFILVTIGTGIGGAIFCDGKLYTGSTMYAGEIGHTTLVQDGKKCSCGNQGCWEAYSSGKAMLEMTHALLLKGYKSILNNLSKDDISLQIIIDSSKKGDKLCNYILDTSSKYSGIALSNFINILNPELCLIGGGLSLSGDIFLNKIIQYIELYCLPYSYSTCKVVLTKLGIDAGIIGAAALAFMALL